MRLTHTHRRTPRPESQPRPAPRRSPTQRSVLRVLMGRMAAVTAVGMLVLLLASEPAQAATVHVVALAASVDQVLSNVRNWIMGILAGLATVFLTIGGLRYVMAAGDPGEVQKAKIAFKSAAIGYALAALAPLVVTVLQGIVGT
jgi:hypothetical protein